MTDTSVEVPKNIATPEAPRPNKFSLEVQIGELPYLFRGTIPEKPKEFRWSVHIPTWQEELVRIDAELAKQQATGNRQQRIIYPHEVLDFKGDDGQIGRILLQDTSEADIEIADIESNTWLLIAGSPYHNARGVGGFLMNNALTLADIREWTVSAYPSTDGRLDNDEMKAWLKNKGFVEQPGGLLKRSPGQPDMTLPIVRALQG